MWGDLLGTVGGKVLEFALPPLLTIAATLAVGVLKRLFTRLGVQLDEDQEAALRRVVSDAIKRVEEEARRHPMRPEDKKFMAQKIVREALPKLDPLRVPGLIDTVLPEVRAQMSPTPFIAVPVPAVAVPAMPGTFGK